MGIDKKSFLTTVYDVNSKGRLMRVNGKYERLVDGREIKRFYVRHPRTDKPVRVYPYNMGTFTINRR